METLFPGGGALLLLAFVVPLITLSKPGKTSRRISLCILLAGITCITTAALTCFFSSGDYYRTIYTLTPV